MKVLYSTRATARGGRDGHAASADRQFTVKLGMPRELGGAGAEGTNPETLFAAGYAACFLSALRFVAAQGQTVMGADSTVTANVGVGPRDDAQGYGLDIALEVSMPGMDRVTAESLVAKAHIVCPYSHATRNNIDVRLMVI